MPIQKLIRSKKKMFLWKNRLSHFTGVLDSIVIWKKTSLPNEIMVQPTCHEISVVYFMAFVQFKLFFKVSFHRSRHQIISNKLIYMLKKIFSPIVVMTVPEKKSDPIKLHFSNHPLVKPQLSASVMISTNSFISWWLMLYLTNMSSIALFAFRIPSCSLWDSSCLKTTMPNVK